MRGILLAGGAGTRLYPLTLVASKQLQPVYDKPMVYYPLANLIEAGLRDLCLISTPGDLPRYRALLGDGSRFGVRLEYREQPRPEGIAQAFLIAASFVGSDPVALALGDNLLLDATPFREAVAGFTGGATVFGLPVSDPERYGVVELDGEGRPIALEEKPPQPRSSWAVPGLYLYDATVVGIARALRPGPRGELEITDVNREFLRRGQLRVHRLPEGAVCLDAGTGSSRHAASVAVCEAERRLGIRIGCPEWAAYHRGFLDREMLAAAVAAMPPCDYREPLERLLAGTGLAIAGG
ncbi:MAG: NTP transferase domain-containing protein [Verrucomicrobiae bacterium]|nr:NTP transferase domain-containing protein [Verrucomicrobiae bacterium]